MNMNICQTIGRKNRFINKRVHMAAPKLNSFDLSTLEGEHNMSADMFETISMRSDSDKIKLRYLSS